MYDDKEQLIIMCVLMSDLSRHCECDMLTCANPDLSFDERSRWMHLHTIKSASLTGLATQAKLWADQLDK